jgi:hypothetical protein
MSTTFTTSLLAGSSRTSGVSSQAITNTSLFLGSEIDNSANLDLVADVVITYAFGVNPTAGTMLQFYLVYAPDGTNYEDGGDTYFDGSHGIGTSHLTPAPQAMIGGVSVVADTYTHCVIFREVPLLPSKMKLLVYNNATGQTVTVTALIYTRNVKTVG